MGKKREKQGRIVTPGLPLEVPDDEIEVSDEDVQFLKDNYNFASFLSCLDTNAFDRKVTSNSYSNKDTLEASYEKRMQDLEKTKDGKNGLIVDPVDALPVKTLDGELYYRTISRELKEVEDGKFIDSEENMGASFNVQKLTKAEKWLKMKKCRKEARKQKELERTAKSNHLPQASVLEEVVEDISAEKDFENKKLRIAELGAALLENPESNVKSLKEMLRFCKDGDHEIVKLSLLSLLVALKDIIPGYRIRLPTEKEMEMSVSKDVLRRRSYESALLLCYKAYLQKLMTMEKLPKFKLIVVRCMCTLLDAVTHFNFWESLLSAVISNIGSSDEAIRNLCFDSIKSLFVNKGKHGGEVILVAVKLIANIVKTNNCQWHPNSIQVLLYLSFDDIEKSEKLDGKNKPKIKKKRRRNKTEGNPFLENNKKKMEDMAAKMREEVDADYRSVAFTPDEKEQKWMQLETLSSVFETYFRILKQALLSIQPSSQANASASSGPPLPHPLLCPCLDGLGKFSHLIDLDYIGDLMNYLKKLASGGDCSKASASPSQKVSVGLTVSERLRCCIVGFKVMRANLDALNVDLHGFFVQLYILLLEYRPATRGVGQVLAEALKIMLCEDRQHDMQKTAAFVKRLATFSLCFGSPESMAAIVTVKHLLQKNVKCRNLLENDPGGGSVSGLIVKYEPRATDPNLSGALASVLWDLNLLSRHYHPSISTLTTDILNMSTSHKHSCLPSTSPPDAFTNVSLEQEEPLALQFDTKLPKNKRKRELGSSKLCSSAIVDSFDEEQLRDRLTHHFALLQDIKKEQEARSGSKLNRATLASDPHPHEEEHRKKHKKHKNKTSIKT